RRCFSLASLPCRTPDTSLFYFNDTAPTDIYTLSLHDALPISPRSGTRPRSRGHRPPAASRDRSTGDSPPRPLRDGAALRRSPQADRKSTRLNSSHVEISYAVFCLKKKKKKLQAIQHGP